MDYIYGSNTTLYLPVLLCAGISDDPQYCDVYCSHLHLNTCTNACSFVLTVSLTKTRLLHFIFLFCTMTNKCTIISQIITLLRVSTLSCHPQGSCNQHLAKLNNHYQQLHLKSCVTWQGIYYKLPADDTIVSKHVGV